MNIYCDSSTKEACIIFNGLQPTVIPYEQPVTTNVGEYKAVILALEEARNAKLMQVKLQTDSLLVVNQVEGFWKCRKPHLLPLRDRVRELLKELENQGASVEFVWVPREENPAGRVLEEIK